MNVSSHSTSANGWTNITSNSGNSPVQGSAGHFQSDEPRVPGEDRRSQQKLRDALNHCGCNYSNDDRLKAHHRPGNLETPPMLRR